MGAASAVRQPFGVWDGQRGMPPARAVIVAMVLGLGAASCGVEGTNRLSVCTVKPTSITELTGRVLQENGEPVARPLVARVVRRAPGSAAATGAEGDAGVTPAEPEVVYETLTDDWDGAYRFSGVSLDIAVDPGADCPRGSGWDYELLVTDPEQVFADARLPLFSLTDGPLALTDLYVERRFQAQRGAVVGRLLEASRLARPLADVSVTLTRPGETEPAYRTVAGFPDGTFRFDGVELQQYRIHFGDPDEEPSIITGPNSGLAARMIPLDDEVALHLEPSTREESGSLLVDLGRRFMLPATGRNDLRIVLSWEPREAYSCDSTTTTDNRDVDLWLSLPGPGCDVNSLAGFQVEMGAECYGPPGDSPDDCLAEARAAAISPAGRFGEGTCYWPSSLGGQADDPNRVRVDFSNQVHRVPQLAGIDCTLDESSEPLYSGGGCAEAVVATGDGCALAALDNDSRDGLSPEVITLFPERLAADFPQKLGHFYEDPVASGGAVRRYPTGVATVGVRGGGTGRVWLQVFDGDRALPRRAFDLRGEDQTSLVVELGYHRASPSATTDGYHRVFWADGLPPTLSQRWSYEDLAARQAGFRAIGAASAALGSVWLGADDGSGPAVWQRRDDGSAASWARVASLPAPARALVEGEGAVLVAAGTEVLEVGGAGRGPVACADPVLSLMVPRLPERPSVVYAGTSAGLALVDLDTGTCTAVSLGCGLLTCTPIDGVTRRVALPLLRGDDAPLAGAVDGGLWSADPYSLGPDGLLIWSADEYAVTSGEFRFLGATPLAALDAPAYTDPGFETLFATSQGAVEDYFRVDSPDDLRALAVWDDRIFAAGGRGLHQRKAWGAYEPVASHPPDLAVDHLVATGEHLYVISAGGAVLRFR